MRIDVARLDFLLRRRLLLGYVVGMALYVFVIVAIYPQFKDSTSLNSLTQDSSTLAALFGISGSITSPGGWLNANIYANFFPLIALLLTIGYGAATIAGQDEDGTLCLLAVLPMRRSSIILQKAATMFLQSLALALAVAISIATMLMSLDFGLIAMAVGAATGSRGVALGVGTAAAAIAYFVSSLAPVVHWIHSARYVSLLYWAVGNDQITRGVTLTDYLVLVAVGICVLGAAVLAFRRLDLR
jgi:ABC-2 type transport system permease protein